MTLAEEIQNAWTTGALIPTPSSGDQAFDMPAAYAVEAELRERRAAAGHKVVGLKVGFANKAMWRVLKLETLVWAAMYDDTVHRARNLSLTGCIAPRIEPEIVLEVGQAASIESVALGFEIIDCPYPDWQFKPADFVAAFGLHRALVVGPSIAPDAAIIEALGTFKLKLLKNGALVEEGSGKNSLRSPALCLAELARVTPVSAGYLVSTGTLTNAQPVAPGETWQAEVEGLPLAGLQLTF